MRINKNKKKNNKIIYLTNNTIIWWNKNILLNIFNKKEVNLLAVILLNKIYFFDNPEKEY